MKIHLLENRAPSGWTDFGSYWPRGEVTESRFLLTDGQGHSVPCQSGIAARWPDGSVKWARHTADASLLGAGGEIVPFPGVSPFSEDAGLRVKEADGGWIVTGTRLSLAVPGDENVLLRDLFLDGRRILDSARPILSLAHESESGSIRRTETVSCPARITDRILEESGPLRLVFRFDGIHTEQEEEKMPFRIRMYLQDDGEISFDHTFFFRGDAERDRLAALGLRFEMPLGGASWQRHIRYLTDRFPFHDMPTQLFHWKMRLSPDLLFAQMRGETVPREDRLDEAAADLPRWNHFALAQDAPGHFAIRKRTAEDVCWVEGMHGEKAPGTMAVGDPDKTVSFSIRDFREKYPSGLETEGLAEQRAACTAWFYAPQAQPYDFRHYDHRMYVEGCYEGFPYMRSDPNGIAVTSRCTLHLFTAYPSDDTLRRLNLSVRKPPVYTADPGYYHHHRAFGIWSLENTGSEMGAWIEDQIRRACDFYRQEAEARNWYGLFDYGDFMHTYAAARHMWRYDVGGYAWDNTELAPTYWLWLQFLRTSDESVFSLAEALSRHAADVDMYHFGPMRGLGSRHNVRHWGCACKEPRVSMAGHHRPLYYLTGNRRIGDCMEDALQADGTLAETPYYRQPDGTVSLRTGPDWSSLVSNWMTAYERTLDPKWRGKILAGIEGIRKAPLQLTSGPDFTFDPATGDMWYHGESDQTVNMHLQACMAGPEIWLETAGMLGDRTLSDMVARNGRYFSLSPEERIVASGGLLKNRGFGSIIYSADMQAWAARTYEDPAAARDIWRRLLGLLYAKDHPDGFRPVPVPDTGSEKETVEIPWISTNFTAQWCLKVIVCLDLIPAALPATLRELETWLDRQPTDLPLYGA